MASQYGSEAPVSDWSKRLVCSICGSHLLAPAGEAGLAHLQLGDVGADRDVALATGPAGTVYLCHPS